MGGDGATETIPEPVARVAAVMRGSPVTWSLCGGWAVDAWLGRRTRDHQDVDVAVFRDEERAIFEHMGDCRLVAHDTIDAAHDDPWDGGPLDFPAHIHTAFEDGLSWEMQFNERSRSAWILRRSPLITVPLPRFAQVSPWGLPTMVPEVLLWYKAQELRAHDELDLDTLLPQLTDEQLYWLRGAIAVVDPAHRWLGRLTAW